VSWHLVAFVLFLQELNSGASTTASDALIVITNLKSDLGNTERSLRDVVHLEGVNALQVLYGRTDLCEYSPEFEDLLHSIFRRFFHQWGVILQQSLEFME